MTATSNSEAANIRFEMQPDMLIIQNENQSLPVSLKSPLFAIGDLPATENILPTEMKGSIQDSKGISIDYAPVSLNDSAKLEVKLFLKWSKNENILRKWAEYRVTGISETMVVKEIILDSIDVSDRTIDFKPEEPQSHPAFLAGFFAGIEFPVASTQWTNDHLVIAHKPGLRIQPDTWYSTKIAVYGAADIGKERRTFERYIAAHRPSPKGFHLNYNSWWTSPVPYAEEDIINTLNTFNEKLYKPYNTTFDSFCIDMGWSTVKSMWEIDTKRFPQGFTDIQNAAEKMNSNLGLWISPSSCYPGALDNHWAQEQGYETYSYPMWGDPNMRLACLAGKRYGGAFADRIAYMAEFNGVKQYKLDGCILQCPDSDHGHEPGELSSEATAEGVIAALTKARKARPDVWFEPTCFGFNPSPWWLFHVNSVIGTFGDDSPFGRVPSPVYRESYTSARDYFNLQGAYHMPIPIVAQEVLGIIHQSSEPFMNDAVITIMRGHMFIPAYINPKWMDDSRWKSLAGLMKWARQHEADLQETEPLIPESWQKDGCPAFTHDAVMPREPYGYAHWSKDAGLVAIRNPWIKSVTYKLKIGDIASEHGSLSAVSVYPEARVYGTGLNAGDTLDIKIAPYETVVLSIESTQPASNIPSAKDILKKKIKADVQSLNITRVALDGNDQSGPDKLSPLNGIKDAVSIKHKSTVTIDAPSAELLILIEDKTTPVCPVLNITVNGCKTEYTGSGSETGWAATMAPKPEHWLFLRAPLQSGVNDIEFELLNREGTPRISAWVWATKKGIEISDTNLIPQPETISLDSYNLMGEINTLASDLLVPKAERPIQKIDGIFIDALELDAAPSQEIYKRNASVSGSPLNICGKRFSRGIGTAPSRITVPIDGQYKRFQSWVGLDDALAPNYMDRSSVSYEVWVDGTKRWESDTVSIGSPALFADIDVSGGKSMELVVLDKVNGKYPSADWSIWAEAKLLK